MSNQLIRSAIASALLGICFHSNPAPVLSAESVPSIPADHAQRMRDGLGLFTQHVRPLLIQRCLKCHGGDAELQSGFNLATRDGMLAGGINGKAIVPGKSRESRLYRLITHSIEPAMPQDAPKLSDVEIARIAAWIDAGAPYGESLLPPSSGPSWTERRIAAKARSFWSFQPLSQAVVPRPADSSRLRSPVDAFIEQGLESRRLRLGPEVDRARLIRRLSFDLIGLPPSPAETAAFVVDPSLAAYETLVDRLLASPHYGERWARHWLDLARFAESHGFEHDYDRPSAYHFRDFVIRALNADLPYDRFVRWQLAGDELAPDNQLAMMATGFLAAGVHSTQITKNEVEKQRYDELDDMLATTSTSVLGLSVGCARCHDHKFDPFPQADYYRLLSAFTTTVRSEVDLGLDRDGYNRAKAAFDRDHARLTARLAAAKKKEDVARLKKAVEKHAASAPQPPKVLVASEGLPPLRLHSQGDDFFKQTYFLERGDTNRKRGVAQVGFLQVLTRRADAEKHWIKPPPAGSRTSLRRTALATWLMDDGDGAGALAARVIVNRLWQHHLGHGIVSTPNDFGARGERPSHPQLLDWLARELIRHEWRLKPIHKLIVTSAVYMQDSQADQSELAADPDNRLFGRHERRRLEAEVVRDAVLVCGNRLDERMYGPGTLDESHRRRSIYFTVKRSRLAPMMQVFDAPEALSSMGDRPSTTIAPQALLLLNNPNVRRAADSFAMQLRSAWVQSPEEAVRAGYRMALGREADADELAESAAFLRRQTSLHDASRHESSLRSDGCLAALADFCQTLFCLNEFIYVD